MVNALIVDDNLDFSKQLINKPIFYTEKKLF